MARTADSDGSAVSGQMTEAAAQAKRLFDSERWNDAATALALVMNGSTGDDEGNRQVAQYHFGIAHYRMRDVEGALEVFVSIASQPRHLKFQETALWLSKLVDEPAVALRAIDALYPYAQESLARFDNSQQRETYGSLEFASGRAALRHGDLEVAAARFKAVTRDSRFAGLASDCLRFVHGAAVAR